MILGVVGAGTMGAGIAQLGCAAGLETRLLDPDERALDERPVEPEERLDPVLDEPEPEDRGVERPRDPELDELLPELEPDERLPEDRPPDEPPPDRDDPPPPPLRERELPPVPPPDPLSAIPLLLLRLTRRPPRVRCASAATRNLPGSGAVPTRSVDRAPPSRRPRRGRTAARGEPVRRPAGRALKARASSQATPPARRRL